MKTLILFIAAFTLFLSASAQYAPDSLKGLKMAVTVIYGDGFYAPAGSTYKIEFSTDGHSYAFKGGTNTLDSSGFYFYTKTGSNSAMVALYDYVDNATQTGSVTFTSSSAGTFLVSDYFGTNRANFTFTIPSTGGNDGTGTGADWVYMKIFPWIYIEGKGWYYAFSDPFWLKSSNGQNWIEIK